MTLALRWSLIVLMPILLGCDSDDNKGTDSTPKLEGDPSDPVLQVFDWSLEGTEEWCVELINIPKYAVDSVIRHPEFPTDRNRVDSPLAPNTAQGVDSVLFEFDDDNMYWHMSVVREVGVEDTIRIEFTDSVQIWQDNAPVQWPDSTKISSIRYGFDYSMTLSGNPFVEAQQKAILTGNPFGQDAVILNGRGLLEVVGMYFTDVSGQDVCSASVSLFAEFSNLALVPGEWLDLSTCPPSGMLSLRGWFDIECSDTSLSSNDYWRVWELYSGDQIAITAENSTTRWVYTVPGCRGGSWPLSALRDRLRSARISRTDTALIFH